MANYFDYLDDEDTVPTESELKGNYFDYLDASPSEPDQATINEAAEERPETETSISEFQKDNPFVDQDILREQKEKWGPKEGGDLENYEKVSERLKTSNTNSLFGNLAAAVNQDPELPEWSLFGDGAREPIITPQGAASYLLDIANYATSMTTKGYVEMFDAATEGDVRSQINRVNDIVRKESMQILGNKNMQYTGNDAQKLGWEIGEAAINMGGSLMLGWGFKNPGLAFGAISAQVGGAAYNDYMEKTGDHNRAMAKAKFDILSEVIPEALPVMAMLRKAGAGQATRRLLETTLGEGFQEGLTEILQSTYDDVQLKDMTLGEALKGIDWSKVGHAALVGAGVGGVLSGPGIAGDILAGRSDENLAIQDAFTPDFEIKPVEDNATAISDILDSMAPSAAQFERIPGGEIFPIDRTTLDMKPVDMVLGAELGLKPVSEVPQKFPEDGLVDEPLEPSIVQKRLDEAMAGEYDPLVDPEAPVSYELIKTDIDKAAHEAAASPTNERLEPTEAQIEANNYKKGKLSVNGINISIENPKGSIRRGTDPDGKEWAVELQSHYGEFSGTKGADGDPLDAFLADNAGNESLPVFIINQVDPKTKEFDETKTIFGAATKEEAESIYLSNYEEGWSGLKNTSELTKDELKAWLKEGDTKAPYSPKVSHETMTAEQRQAEIEGTLSTEEDIVETAKAERRMIQSQKATTRTRQSLQPDSENDDLATYIRKLGGIDTDTESDVRGRLSHLNANNRMLGLPSIEQKGGKGMTLDALGEDLIASGYLKADPAIGNGVDKDALLDLLFEMEGGEPVMLISAQDRVAREKYDEGMEEAQKVWEAQQEVEELEQLRSELDAMENISPDLDKQKIARLLDQANDVSEQRTEDILSKDVPDADVVKLLEDMINEDRKPAKKYGLESIAESDQEVSQPQKVEQAEARQEELRLAEESKPSQEKEAMVDPIRPGTAKESQESLEIPTIQEEKPSEKQEQAEKKAVEAQAAEEITIPDRRAEGKDRQERRIDTSGRKRVSEMTSEEMSSALLTNEKSGLKNERAYEEDNRLDYQSFFDIDNFKEINTQYTYDGADKILTAFGDVIQKAEMDGVVAYHLHGDEFIVQSNSEKDLKAFSDKIQENLYSMEIVIDLPGVDIKTATNVGASYGIGKTKEKAESSLKKDKEARAKAGLRSEREREPGGLPEAAIEARRGKDTKGRVSVSKQLEATKIPESGEYPNLKDISLKMDTETEAITQTAKWWLDDVDSRIKEVNKLRDCF